MQILLEDASSVADRFEALLVAKGVSIPAHASTESTCSRYGTF